MKNKAFIIGIIIVAIFVFVAIFADVLAPYDPNEIVDKSFLPPSEEHILGTNDIGQDLFSEMIIGTRYSLIIATITTVISMTIAVILGVCAGWYQGVMDNILNQINAFFLAIPFIPLVIILAVFLQGGLLTTALTIAIVSWPETAKVLRSQTKKIKTKEYIVSIKAMGASDFYIIKNHVLKELFPLLAQNFTVRFRAAILAESTLSFLGLGSAMVKSWGNILYYAQSKNAFITEAWKWWVIPPGIMIATLIFALMLIGYGIEAKTDPRLSGGKLS